MLSYRHAFHAGNHADVLKHWLLSLCLEYLTRKDKPLLYLDTHAGAGCYSLSDKFATTTGEYQQGIAHLWNCADLPEVFSQYLSLVGSCNDNELSMYPGSCLLAAKALRATDRIILTEQHTTDFETLRSVFKSDKRVQIKQTNGFAQLKAQLPPVSRRGLVLIDPSYEIKSDYQAVSDSVVEGLKRFATGTYLIWYPLLTNEFVEPMRARLRALGQPWLDVAITVAAKPSGHGMYGSGVHIINPPYLLAEQLQQGLPWLTEMLAQDADAGYQLHNNND